VLAWHVDDLKVSHVKVGIADDFITQMDNEFSKEMPLNKPWGKSP